MRSAASFVANTVTNNALRVVENKSVTSAKELANTSAADGNPGVSNKSTEKVTNKDPSIKALDVSKPKGTNISSKTEDTTDSKDSKKTEVTAKSDVGTDQNALSIKINAATSDTGTNSSTAERVKENVSTTSESSTAVQKPASVASEGHNVKIGRWRHSTADCLACVPTRPPSSHELREAFFAGEFILLLDEITLWPLVTSILHTGGDHVRFSCPKSR